MKRNANNITMSNTSRYVSKALKKGSLGSILQSLYYDHHPSLHDIIKSEELSRINIIHQRIQDSSECGQPLVYFPLFRTKLYRAKLTIPVSNTYQLERPAFSTRSQTTDKKKSSMHMAKELASTNVLIDALGRCRHDQEIKSYASNLDMLYGYCNKQGYGCPIIFPLKVEMSPSKSTAFIRSTLIKRPGEIVLHSDRCPSYGTALWSVCELLSTVLTELEILQVVAS